MENAKKPPSKPPAQVDKFRQLARELDCDPDEDAFKAAVRKVARSPRLSGEKTGREKP